MELFRVFMLVFLLYIVGIKARIKYNTVPVPDSILRVTQHSPKIVDKTCLLNPSRGPCRAEIDMFYFQPDKMLCSTFQWGGCQGNGNRFETLEECMGTCLSQPGRKDRPKYCQLKFDYGFCFGDTKRWYYDQKWQVCKEVVYSGCGGNKNNFYSQEECDSICRFGLGRQEEMTTNSDSLKKVLYINPSDTTPQRGRDQNVPKGKKSNA